MRPNPAEAEIDFGDAIVTHSPGIALACGSVPARIRVTPIPGKSVTKRHLTMGRRDHGGKNTKEIKAKRRRRRDETARLRREES